MTIQAGQRMVVAGGAVFVPVYLLLTDDVANLNFEIAYNTGVVSVEGAVFAGNLDSDRAFRANPGDPGIIRVGFA